MTGFRTVGSGDHTNPTARQDRDYAVNSALALVVGVAEAGTFLSD
jgi:hypothetical protein